MHTHAAQVEDIDPVVIVKTVILRAQGTLHKVLAKSKALPPTQKRRRQSGGRSDIRVGGPTQTLIWFSGGLLPLPSNLAAPTASPRSWGRVENKGGIVAAVAKNVGIAALVSPAKIV